MSKVIKISEALDTTFTQCPHGKPKCEQCKNKRVIEWIKYDKNHVLLNKPVLVTDGQIFDITSFTQFDSGIAMIKCKLKTHATYWADISHIDPITTCQDSGIQFNDKGKNVGFI